MTEEKIYDSVFVDSSDFPFQVTAHLTSQIVTMFTVVHAVVCVQCCFWCLNEN